MSNRYKDLKETVIGASNKRLLLVEGVADITFFQNLFERTFGVDYLNQHNILLTDAQSKRNVITFLEKEPSWMGVIDRDE